MSNITTMFDIAFPERLVIGRDVSEDWPCFREDGSVQDLGYNPGACDNSSDNSESRPYAGTMGGRK